MLFGGGGRELGGLSGMGAGGTAEGWMDMSLATVGCLVIVAGPDAEFAQKGSGSGSGSWK